MAEKLLFLTGHLAEQRLRQQLTKLGAVIGDWHVQNIGVKVAALMTEAIVRKRLSELFGADRVVVPGRSRMDLRKLSGHFGVEFVRGPDELIDLPYFFGHGGTPPDLSSYDVRIFAEIVDAPQLPIDAVIARANAFSSAGANVIDIGCQPDVPFEGLEEVVTAIKENGLQVSVDSGDREELTRAARAGADYVLSLDETSLDVVAETDCVPILVPKSHGDLNSLLRAIDEAKKLGIDHIADPILDPIHFGFTKSIERYAELRRLRPDVEILMGTGNLTELTDSDSQGVTAVMMGLCSELEIRNVLLVQVSAHTRRTVEEHDAARRLMFRAKSDASLPKGYGEFLLSLHALNPFVQSPEEIAESAAAVRDLSYRIEAAADGVHIFNRNIHECSREVFDLFEHLDVEDDAGHAFYLGYELAKAEIASQLGKRYIQDQGLDWGVASDRAPENTLRHAKEGATLKAKRAKEAKERHARRLERDDDI